jgi:hypothetical protein
MALLMPAILARSDSFEFFIDMLFVPDILARSLRRPQNAT